MSLETWKSDVQVLPPVRLPAPLDEGEGVLGGVSLLRNQDRDKLTFSWVPFYVPHFYRLSACLADSDSGRRTWRGRPACLRSS